MDMQRRGNQILVNGLVMVIFGLIWGLAIPHTPFPRLALGAHIQFTLNGILFIVMAVLLLALPHNVSGRSASIMLVAAGLTWTMALSELGNSWWGTNQLLSLAAQQAGAMGGTIWQELIVKITHISASIALIIAWILLVAGFWTKHQSSS